jgi:hypothetical protein
MFHKRQLQAEFTKLTKRLSTLVQFLQQSPLKGLKLDLKRDKSLSREDTNYK